MSFKVKNISITGSKITFTIPQGAVVTKIFGGNSGAYVLDKAYRYTIPLNLGKINVNNNLWGPITGEFTFPKGTAPHLNDASKREIPGMTIYAKCSGSGQNGHFKIVKFGVYLKDTGTSYIEDFNCQDDSYASALNCLLADGKTRQIMVNKDAIKQEEPAADPKNKEKELGKRAKDPRVQKMQQALNAAGYVDMEGKKLNPDGRLGDRTRFVAKQAGINPDTWNGTPAITPKSQAQQGAAQPAQQQQNMAQPAQQSQVVTQPAQQPQGVQQTTFSSQPIQFDRNQFQQAQQRVNAEAAKQKLIQNQQQTKANLFNKLDQMAKSSSKKDNSYVEQIKGFVNSGDYYNALATCNKITNVGWKPTLRKLLNQAKTANDAVAQQQIETVNEVRNKFYDMLNRINNATILQ